MLSIILCILGNGMQWNKSSSSSKMTEIEMINKSSVLYSRTETHFKGKVSRGMLSIIIVLWGDIKQCRISNKLMSGLMHIKEDGNDSINVRFKMRSSTLTFLAKINAKWMWKQQGQNI